jgi:hypothetical protein
MNLILNMKDINKKLAKIESYVWEKIAIADPLLYHRPLLLRQLKINQNQTNTTGAQNFKEFNKTGYSDMLDISYLFNNNTFKRIKAKIFPFNSK